MEWKIIVSLEEHRTNELRNEPNSEAVSEVCTVKDGSMIMCDGSGNGKARDSQAR